MPENEGRDTNSRGRGNDLDDNVVRFPRDWFGPVEELTPIGPGGDEERPADEQCQTIGSPKLATADDFWGESSAEIQQFVQAPAIADQTVDVRPPPSSVRSRLSNVRPRMSVPRPRRAHLAVAALIAVAVPAVLAGGLLNGGAKHESAQNTSRLSAAVSFTSDSDRSHQGLLPAVLSSKPGRPHHHTRSNHGAGRAAARRRPEESNAGTTSSNSSNSSAASSGTTQPVEQLSPERVSQEPATSGGTSASAAAAGPVGPGAAFGPGQMG